MKSETFDKNKIALAYDSRFDILEGAREEYSNFVKKTLHKIQNNLKYTAPVNICGREIDIRAEKNKSEQSSKEILEVFLKDKKLGEDLDIIIQCRFASPWGGESGYIQLIMSAKLDEKLVHFDINELRDKITIKASSSTSCPIDKRQWNDDWIHAEALSLDMEDLENKASSRIIEMIQDAEIGLEIVDEKLFTKKVKDSLEELLTQLKTSDIEYCYKFQEKVGWEIGMHFIQIDPEGIDSKGKPHYWAGYHVKRQELMYGHDGHDTFKECPNIAQKVAEMLGAKEGKADSSDEEGVFYTRDDLSNIPTSEWTDKLGQSFFKFVDLQNECAS